MGCTRATSPRELGERRGPGAPRHRKKAQHVDVRARLAARTRATRRGSHQRSLLARFPPKRGWYGVSQQSPPWHSVVGELRESHPLATPAPGCSRCAGFARVPTPSEHPPAPGSSRVGPEPLVSAQTCAVSSGSLLGSPPPHREAKPHREEIAGFGAFIPHHQSSDVQPMFKLFYYSWEAIWNWRLSCGIGFFWSFPTNVLAARCCPDLWLGAAQRSQTQIPSTGGPKPFAPSCPRAEPCRQGTE